MTAEMLKEGESGVIKALLHSEKIKGKLLDMGVLPGVRITLLRRAPFGGPAEFALLGYTLAIRLEDAGKIILQEVG